jgi:hypothetical protein
MQRRGRGGDSWGSTGDSTKKEAEELLCLSIALHFVFAIDDESSGSSSCSAASPIGLDSFTPLPVCASSRGTEKAAQGGTPTAVPRSTSMRVGDDNRGDEGCIVLGIVEEVGKCVGEVGDDATRGEGSG